MSMCLGFRLQGLVFRGRDSPLFYCLYASVVFRGCIFHFVLCYRDDFSFEECVRLCCPSANFWNVFQCFFEGGTNAPLPVHARGDDGTMCQAVQEYHNRVPIVFMKDGVSFIVYAWPVSDQMRGLVYLLHFRFVVYGGVDVQRPSYVHYDGIHRPLVVFCGRQVFCYIRGVAPNSDYINLRFVVGRGGSHVSRFGGVSPGDFRPVLVPAVDE